MELIRGFPKLAYAQVILGMLAYGVAAENPAVALAAATLCMLSWFLVESADGRPLPRWMINLSVAVVTAWLFFSQIAQWQPLIYNLGLYILFLQLCKLWERKANRDWTQLIVLSLMQMVCASIVSNRVIFAALLFAYLLLAMLTVMVLQLKLGHDRAADGAPRPPVVSGSGRACRRHFRRMFALCGLFCMLLGAAVFMAMPRGRGAGFLGSAEAASRRNVSGFNSQVQLTTNTRVNTSEAPVMNVRLTRDGQPYGASGHSFLLRGSSLDEYDTRTHRWVRGRARYNDWTISNYDGGRLVARRPDRPVIEQHIMLRGATRGILFSAFSPVRFVTDRPKIITFNPYDQVFKMHRYHGGSIEYAVESVEPRPGENITAEYLRAPRARRLDWERYARGPVLADPRVEALARRLLAEMGRSRERAMQSHPADHRVAAAVEKHMRQRCRYSLDLPAVSVGEDPIGAFLFSHRTGHCEYFASGMCAVLREMGIRARVVSGYAAGEYNAVGGYYVIRQKNAHAWVEVWTDEAGWRAFDPSPPGDIAQMHRPRDGLLAGLMDFYDYLEFQWVNKVITYDQTQRRGLIQSINDRFRAMAGAGLGAWRWALQRTGGAPGLLTLMGGVVLALTWVSWRGGRRKRDLRRLRLAAVADRDERRRLVRQLGFYLKMLDRLRRAGHEKPESQTPAAFAAAVAGVDPRRFGSVVPLTDLYYEIRFGGRPLDDGRRRRIQAHLAELSKAA